MRFSWVLGDLFIYLPGMLYLSKLVQYRCLPIINNESVSVRQTKFQFLDKIHRCKSPDKIKYLKKKMKPNISTGVSGSKS